MATSNVKYYEKQKELQDTITNCEQQRMNLERHFQLALKADQTSSRMKAARLHTYWKKICEEESRAKQRNEMLLREFQRIDAHMSEMNAKTQQLALMKKQYEVNISRTYPDWNELVYGTPQQHQPSKGQTEHEKVLPVKQPQQSQELKAQNINCSPAANLRDTSQSDSGSKTSHKLRKEEQQLIKQQQLRQDEHELHQIQEHQQSQMQWQKDQLSKQFPPNQGEAQLETQVQRDDYSLRIYANLPSARIENTHSHSQDMLTPTTSKQESEERLPELFSQPIKSIEILSKTSSRTSQGNDVMQPEEDEEDEEMSEFDELPMGHSLGNTQIPVSTQPSTEKITRSIKPELSVDGLICLLRHVEADIADSFSQEGYYRSSWPTIALKNDIIRKANNAEDLNRIDVNSVSMVILEQITLIVRSLTEKCILPESLLKRNINSLTAAELRLHLSAEAQVIWDALFTHFIKLVRCQVMEPNELSAIFTPCLVVDGGSQDKAHTFIVHMLEEMRTSPVENLAMPSPGQTMEGSGSLMEDGKVPPLKFGSLLDKPLSDDESSYINSSLPRDSVPLNETDAYKSIVSGSTGPQRHQSSAHEDTDDDVEKQIASALVKPVSSQPSSQKKLAGADDPSEASSLHTSSHVYVTTAMESRRQVGSKLQSGPARFQGVKISSDLDTDTEVDAGIFGSSRQPGNNYDFDFYD